MDQRVHKVVQVLNLVLQLNAVAAHKQAVCSFSLNYTMILGLHPRSLPCSTTLSWPLESKFNKVLAVLCISCSITFYKTLKQCSFLISLLTQTKVWLQQILGWTSHPPPKQNSLLSAWLQMLEVDQALNKLNKKRKYGGKILFIQSQSIYPQCWFTAARRF